MSDRLGILDRLLAYMDRPWRAVVIVVSIVILGIGYACWEKRAEIAEAILTREVHPRLLTGQFKPLGLKLLKDADADAVMLIQGNLNTNIARDIDGYDRDLKPWVAMTGNRPVFAPESKLDMVIRMLAAEVVCYDVNDGGPEIQAEERAGMKRACVVVVPPISATQLVGALWLGWRSALAPDNENHVQYLMHQTAAQLANW